MEVKQYVEKYRQQLLDYLSTLVSYNSVEGQASADAPFGQGPKDCLHAALKICDELGFETKNLDNYCGYAQIGQGEQVIGVLGHLDIVPCGEGWDSDPFKMDIRDGKVYGRGVSDDKGAVVASMIALKILKDMGIDINKRVRLIMGCNEETGSRCLAHYVECEGHIDMGFTPDGDFPGVHGEKGMIAAMMKSKTTKIIDIKGGVASNVVCNHCIVKVEKNSFSKRLLEDHFNNNDISYTIEEDDDIITLDVKGVSAHASTPDLGVNAISHALYALKTAGYNDPFVDFYCSHIGLETDGKMLGVALSDDYGSLTLNNGVIYKEGDTIYATIDIRFPVTMISKQIVGLMEENLEDENGVIEIQSKHEPLFYPIDSPLVSKLLSAYQEVTQDYDTLPMTMGGGTYAKGIHNCIAFGCAFLGEDNHIHDANESCAIESLMKQVEIYTIAIMKLLEN
ncbi:MAG: Sapep family Mn(2+)-dependent dipeptidase [Erysipelotrichaceae bacterium]|nr:Sapep family Mn(2+)-dependent dipeptidase [Erysipelotrichaceae bacterium]